ncbi:IclR family transcriptional regulator [Glutamicibacter nicotianae]
MAVANKEVGTLSSAQKVLEIIFSFSAERTELTVAQMSELLGSTTPTTYRYLALLKSMDLVVEGKPGRYHPTARVMPLARAAQLTNPLSTLAVPLLEQAVSEIGETVMLMEKVGDWMICTELVECSQSMRFTIPKGRKVPLGRGASGKMALALSSQATKERYITEKMSFEDLDAIKKRGYARSFSEIDDGAVATSVPTYVRGQQVATLTTAGPTSRMNDEQQQHALEVLQRIATLLGKEFEKISF